MLDLKRMVKTELCKENNEATENLPLGISWGTRKERTVNFETEKLCTEKTSEDGVVLS